MATPVSLVFDILAVDRASAVFTRVGAAAEAAGAKTSATEAKMAAFTAALKTPLGALGLAAAAAAVVSTKMAADFQTNMLRIQTQAGKSAGEVARMSKAVLALAPSVGTGPELLADSLYHLESVGLSGAKAMDVLKVAAEGAKVGNADLELTTNALSAAVVSGIPGVENMQQAMGALNAVVGAGDMKLSDLTEAMGTGLLAVVKNFGLSLNDVGAALATFGDNNIRGANAATDLRMAVMSLSQQASPGVAALKGIGIQAGQLAQDMQQGGLNQALTDLHQHLVDSGNDGVKMGTFLEDAFTKKAGVGLAVLLDQFDRFQTKEEEVAAGSTKFGDAWQATSESLNFKFSQVRATVDELSIRLGLALLPAVNSALDGISHMASELAGGLATASKMLAPTWQALADVLHDVWIAAGDIVQAFGPLVKLLGELAAVAVIETLNALAHVVAVVADAFVKFQLVVVAAGVALVTWNALMSVTLVKTMAIVYSSVVRLGGALLLATGELVAATTSSVGFAAALEGVGTALAGVISLEAAATLGFSLVVAAGLIAWHNYSSTIKDAQKALQDFNSTSKSGDLSTQVKAIDGLTAGMQATRDKYQQIKNEGFFQQAISWDHAGELAKLKDAIDADGAAAQEARGKLSSLTGELSDYTLAQLHANGATQDQITAFLSSGTSSKVWTDLMGTANSAGVKLGDSTATVAKKMQTYTDAQKLAAQGSPELASAMQSIVAPADEAKDAAKALKDELDNLGKGMGSFSDPLGTYKTLLSDKSAAEQAAAQKTADATKKSTDSWKDYVKKSSVSLDEWSKKLEEQNTNAVNWQTNLVKVAGRAGTDVAEALANMGADGVQLTAQFADGTDAQVSRAAADLRKQMQLGTAGAAQDLKDGFAIMAAESAAGGKLTADQLAAQLQLGTDKVAAIAQQYGIALAAGINPILQGVGAPLINGVNTAAGVTKKLDAQLKADGGYISGPGGPRSDVIPAMLSNGEFVINAGSTAKHRPLLEAINRYADGGFVTASMVPHPPGVSPAQFPVSTPATAGMAKEYAAVVAKVQASMAAAFGGAPGAAGGGARWADVILQVLSLLGQPASLLAGIESLINMESGGNPNAINLTDSNARAGHPSQGLMQTIPSTFARWAGPYASLGITNPLANIYAGVNYALHTYGPGMLAAGGRHTAGGGYLGYDTGGVLPHGGIGQNRSGRPERVLSPTQTQSFDRLVTLLEGGALHGGGGKTVNVGGMTLVDSKLTGADIVRELAWL